MRRLALLTLAAPLLLAPAAEAQAPPQLGLDVVGLHQGKRIYVVAKTKVRVAGTINAAAAGDGVTIQLLRKGKIRRQVAAVIDGVLFGLVHGVNVVLPVLIFLGIVLCWVFERTGTLFATIAIHALNNTIAYGASTDHGWAAAVPVGVTVLAACAALADLLPHRRAPAPA